MIGAICASIVCCVPHIIWCCVCRCLCRKYRNKRRPIDNTVTLQSQTATVETDTSANRVNNYTRNQESTEVQVLANIDQDHAYRNVAPSVAMLHRKTNNGKNVMHVHSLCIMLMLFSATAAELMPHQQNSNSNRYDNNYSNDDIIVHQ